MRAENSRLLHCIKLLPVSNLSPFLTRLFASQKSTLPPGEGILSSSVQHIFNKNSVAGCGVIHQHMSNGAYQFSVLNNR